MVYTRNMQEAPQQPAPVSPESGSSQSSDYKDYFADVPKPQAESLILEWQAPSRPFKQRKRQYFSTVITIVLLLSLILFFAGQILPIAVVVAVAFLAYVMATIPPHTITHQITTYGIRTDTELYYWEELGRFWFEKKHNDTVLFIECARFPNRLSLLVGTADQTDLREILSEVLLEEKPPLTQVEKIAEWLQKKVPIDIES